MTISRPWAIALLAALFLSVALNLVIAGFSAARYGGPRSMENSIERIVAIGIRAFPPPIQQAIEDSARDRRDEIRALLDAVQDSRMRMFEAMRADPFDQAALDAAFLDLRTKTTELQETGQAIVAEAVAAAPASVRDRIRPPRGPFP